MKVYFKISRLEMLNDIWFGYHNIYSTHIYVNKNAFVDVCGFRNLEVMKWLESEIFLKI